MKLPRMFYKPQEAKESGDKEKGLARTRRGGEVKANCRIQHPAAFFSVCENRPKVSNSVSEVPSHARNSPD